MITTERLRKQIKWLRRHLRHVSRLYTIAFLAGDEIGMQSNRAEYLTVSYILSRVELEMLAFEKLERDQAAAVKAAEEMLNT